MRRTWVTPKLVSKGAFRLIRISRRVSLSIFIDNTPDGAFPVCRTRIHHCQAQMHHLVILIDRVHHLVSMGSPAKRGRAADGQEREMRDPGQSREWKSVRAQALDDSARAEARASPTHPEFQPKAAVAGSTGER